MRSYNTIATTVLTLAGLAACDGPSDAPTADWILTNGQVLTADADFNIVQAFAIKDDRILAVGSDDAIMALAGFGTERTDLAGRTVVPGLIDNHMHFVRATQQWYPCSVGRHQLPRPGTGAGQGACADSARGRVGRGHRRLDLHTVS